MSGIQKGFGFQTGGPGGGDTNTNVANADLTLDGNHTTDVGANTLTFDSGAGNIIKLVGSDDTLSIGGASPYKMPTARATGEGKQIMSTNGTGGMAMRQSGFSLPFSMYCQGVNSLTYYYPEPMSNNKYLALSRDSGVAAPASWNVLNSTTVRSCTLGSVPAACNVNALNAWVSVLDNGATNTPAIKVEIWKITPIEGQSSSFEVASVCSATTNPTGDSNNKFYLARATSGSDVEGSCLLMPVFVIASEIEELDFDVWIQGSYGS